MAADGRWRTREAVHAGEKIARLVNLGTGRVLNSTEWSGSLAYQGLVRSFWIPQADPDYGYEPDGARRSGYRLEQRSFLYDDALAVLAFVQGGRYTRARDILTELAGLQRPDGSFSFSFDVFRGEVADAYKRAGAIAWLGYAALTYERKTGDRQFHQMTLAVADFLLGLQVDVRNGFGADDPRYGSILGGSGRYDANYDYFEEPIGWASTEHNIDAYFFLRDLFYVTGNEQYGRAADAVKASLLTHHWDAQSNRFFQGVALSGSDASRALDLYSWGGLFALAVGDRQKADALAVGLQDFLTTVDGVQRSYDPNRFNATYETTQPLTGYKPYLDGGEYQAAPNTVWGEGTWGAILFRMRRGEDVSALVSSMLHLQAADESGGVLQVSEGHRSLPYEFHTWPAVGATAWHSIVMSNPDLLWEPDNWNMTPATADLNGKTTAVINGPDDPETYSWTPELPADWTLRVGADGDVQVLDAGGDVRGTIASAWAEDDNDRSVPVRFEIVGNVIQMTVAHRGGPFTYPIVADSNVDTFDGAKIAGVCSLLPGFVPGRDQYCELNRYEKRFCRHHARLCLKFAKDRDKANRMHAHLFTGPLNGSDGTQANAFRHMFWVALMVVSTGPDLDDNERATEFAFAHENYAFESSNATRRKRSRMDLHNNGVGFRLADGFVERGDDDEYMCNLAMFKAVAGELSSDEAVWQANPTEAYWLYTHHPKTGVVVEPKQDWSCDAA